MDLLCCQVLKQIFKSSNVRSASKAVDLAYNIHGPSPPPGSVPIFVLPGFLGSKTNWDNMCKLITSYTYRSVIALDSRNHGDSPHHPSNTHQDLVADVLQLIDTFKINKVIIIGHSLGGITGMLLALTEPFKVANLIVVDVSPVSTPESNYDFFPMLMETMMSVDFKGLNDIEQARKVAEDKLVASGSINANNKEALHFIFANIGRNPDRSFGWKCNVPVLVQHFKELAQFPNIRDKYYMGPTLFIGGSLSYHIQPEDLVGIQQLFPSAHLNYIKEVGHNIHIEDPSTLLNWIMEFLAYYPPHVQTSTS